MKYDNNSEIVQELIEKLQENDIKYFVKTKFTNDLEKGNTVLVVWKKGYKDEETILYHNDIAITQNLFKELFDCEQAFKENTKNIEETAKENYKNREEKIKAEWENYMTKSSLNKKEPIYINLDTVENQEQLLIDLKTLSKENFEDLYGLDLCQYFGQKFRFFCESPPPLTIRTEMLAGYHPKAKNSKQAIHIAFVRLNCSISLSNNQGQAPLGRLASP